MPTLATKSVTQYFIITMSKPDYKKINSGEIFEKLCTDILEAEGFKIESEPKVDRTGFDIIAIEDYKSHRGDLIKVKWKVQCKHFAESNRTLGRKDVEEYIYAFEATRSNDEGLLFIIDTDYSEPAKTVIDNYVNTHKGSRVMIWNGRHLSTILERHPHLLSKYDLIVSKVNYLDKFQSLTKYKGKRVLIISDQSNIAHNLSSIFKFCNFEVVFLPHWNYNDPDRLLIFNETVLKEDFDLIICFLGDTYQFLLPTEINKMLNKSYKNGTSILFFPFFAFCIDKGYYSSINHILPVTLKSTYTNDLNDIRKMLSSFKFGDFSFLFETDLFAEDQYCEIQICNSNLEILPNVKTQISVKHTFEYIEPKGKSKVVLQDLTGNPILVINHEATSKIAYFNTCTHSCLSTMPISSPIEASSEMAIVFNDLFEWMLK